MGQDVPVRSTSAPERPGVGATFLRLGLVSFGGPVAHLGYFRAEVVARRRWLDDRQYADLVGLAQFLPGPASSQVGMGIGVLRAGIPGSLRAWLGFTLPSAVLMIGAGAAIGSGGVVLPGGAVAGLKVAAVAVVAQAVVQMARTLARGWVRGLLAIATALAVLAVPMPWMPPVALLLAGLAGVVLLRDPVASPGASAAAGAGAAAGPGAGAAGEGPPERVSEPRPARMPGWVPAAALAAFVVLLVVLPLAARTWPGTWTTLIAGCYRAGALVFGGGHVVLPLLEDAAVGTGSIGEAEFLAGYGLANALPGPLFTFAGYLGAVADGVLLGAACIVAVFLPGYLLVLAVLGHWHRVQAIPALRRALSAVNAAVVGLLAAALYDPVIRAGVTGWPEAALAGAAFVALVRFRAAPHVVVLACGALGWVFLG
jgi:chromate transporter